MDLRLAGKVAVVTGGSRGIGHCIALALAAEGCHLAICGRSEDVLHRTANEVAALGQQVVSIAADLTKREEAERFVEEAIAEFGGVDLLVANAGGSSGAGLLDATPEIAAEHLISPCFKLLVLRVLRYPACASEEEAV
jgi:3-oxoacyl-[acyl-carrier protein] reductase